MPANFGKGFLSFLSIWCGFLSSRCDVKKRCEGLAKAWWRTQGVGMHEAKNTARALVRIGFDGKVHKYFRGPQAEERYANEVRVLKFLADRGCDFVPKIVSLDDDELYLVTTNAGKRVDHVSTGKRDKLFAKLESFGVRHDDAEVRNITYDERAGQFCIIDFEFATILEPGYPPSPKMESVANRAEWGGTK